MVQNLKTLRRSKSLKIKIITHTHIHTLARSLARLLTRSVQFRLLRFVTSVVELNCIAERSEE